MDSVVSVFISFWGFLSNVMAFAGIIIIPATFYGVLECIKNAVQGKTPGEYKKAFIWTAIGLVLTLAPTVMAVLVSIIFNAKNAKLSKKTGSNDPVFFSILFS